eukprot:14957237-Heterocapsa_arctica.AAC.1
MPRHARLPEHLHRSLGSESSIDMAKMKGDKRQAPWPTHSPQSYNKCIADLCWLRLCKATGAWALAEMAWWS